MLIMGLYHVKLYVKVLRVLEVMRKLCRKCESVRILWDDFMKPMDWLVNVG